MIASFGGSYNSRGAIAFAAFTALIATAQPARAQDNDTVYRKPRAVRYEAARLHSYSSLQLIDLLSSESFDANPGWQDYIPPVEGELVVRRPYGALMQVFRRSFDFIQLSWIYDVLRQLRSPRADSSLRPLVSSANDHESTYYALKYFAEVCDSTALGILNRHYFGYGTSSLEWASTVKFFGKCRFASTVPNLIESLNAASGNLSEAAESSLLQMFPGGRTNFDSPHQEMEWWKKYVGGRRVTVAAPAEAQARCTTDTFALHDDPLQLVTEYVRRDAAGRLPVKRRGYTDWLDGALTCAERATSTVSEVITAYAVELLVRGADTTRVLVHRTRAFTLHRDSTGSAYHLAPDPAEEADTVVVVRTRHSWRIDGGVSGAHRMPAAAEADWLELNLEDRQRLRQTAMRLPGLTMDSVDHYTRQDLPRVWVNVGGESGEPATCLTLTDDGVGRFVGDTLFNPVRWTYTPSTGDLALTLPRLDSAYIPALLNRGWGSPSVAQFDLDVPSRTLHYSLYRNTTSLPLAGWAYVKAGDVPSWQWKDEPIPCRRP